MTIVPIAPQPVPGVPRFGPTESVPIRQVPEDLDRAAGFARFFELTSDLLCIADFDGVLLEVNQAWTEVLGWSRAMLTARPYIELVHPDDVEATLAAAAGLGEGRSIVGFENRYRHRDGRYRWLRWNTTPSVPEQRLYAVVRDVTEQRRRQAFNEDLERVTGVGAWEVELATNRTYWSPGTHAIHGTDLETYDTNVEDGLRFYPTEARDVLEPALAELFASGTPFDLELPFLTIDGLPRWVRTTARASRRDGRIVRVTGTFQDVTDTHEEREGLQRFRDLVQLSEEGILAADGDGTVTFANQRMATMLGTTTDHLVGCPGADLIDTADVEAAERWYQRLSDASDDASRGEVRLRRADGSAVWVQIAARTGRDASGQVRAITVVVTDISEQKARQAALDEARHLLEEAQHLARIGSWRMDAVSGDIEWSPIVYELFGRDPETFTPDAETFHAAVHPDDRDAVRTYERRSRATGHHEVTYRIIRPDGTQRILHELARSIDDAEPMHGLRGTVQDVTERELAKAALSDSEDRLQRVLTATNDGWWDNDLRSGEVFHSDRWWAIHGYDYGDLPDTIDRARVVTLPDDLPAMDAAYAEVLAARAPTFQIAGRIRHKHGHLVPVVIRGLIDYDEHGVPVRVSGATSDVTEVKRAEAIKEEFVSTVSHELRTPLTSVGGALELLATGVTGPLPEDALLVIDIAQRNTARLRVLIDDLLDIEKLLSGHMRLTRTPQPLAPLIEQAVHDHAPYAEGHGVTFAFAGRIDEVRVEVDGRRLEQVLANYLSNAAKFAPAGSTVEVGMRMVGDRVRTEVVDRGPGVPEAFADRVFEKFAQADPSDERSRGGTGLGLAISRELMERQGGEVGFESEPGHTCFWFELPMLAS